VKRRPGVTRITGTPSLLRAMNDQIVVEFMLERGPLTRSQVVQLSGLSKPTAAELLSRLVADGLVTQRGTSSGARGPSAQLYYVNENSGFVCGVNAEDAWVTAVVADVTGRARGQASVAADLAGGQDPVSAVRQVVRAAARRAHVPMRSLRHVVVGVSGAYDPGRDTVLYAGHLPGWDTPGVVDRLRRALGIPLTIENDANLAAVGERTRGCSRGVDTFALLWVAEGLGLAVYFGGRLYEGATGGAGEVGYMLVGGRSVTFQDSVGASAVLQLARRHGLVGESADGIVGAAVRDPGRQSFLRELAERLATGVATIVAVLDPPLLVLSGATCQAGGETLAELTSQELANMSPFRTRLAVSAVVGSPVLAGAQDLAVAYGRQDVFGELSSRPWIPTPPSGKVPA
jgi:predicted NBD/HSP70 family sugar kinase